MMIRSTILIILLQSISACSARFPLIICPKVELTDSRCSQSVPQMTRSEAQDYCRSMNAFVPSEESLDRHYTDRRNHPGLSAALRGKVVWAGHSTSLTRKDVEDAGGVWETSGADTNVQWHEHPTVGSFSAFDWDTGKSVVVQKTKAAYSICSRSSD